MNKESYIYIPVSFITAACLAAVIFVVSGIYPGSERTLLIFDMKEQFVSFYAYLSRVRSFGDLVYTFEGSLGTPLAGLIAYYLASPLSVIYLFFDLTHLPDAIVLVDVLKAGFIGASFAFFAVYREVKEPVKIILLSVCYALSSAAVSFFILPMYLDTLFWLPLIAVSLEELLKKDSFGKSVKQGIIYGLLLFACILTHYYSAYMVCIFLALYAVYLLTEEKRSFKVNAFRYLRFVFWSIIGSLFAGIILLPVIRELLQGKVSDSGVYSNGKLIVAGPWQLLKQFFCGSFGGLYSEGGPCIYCTIIMICLAVYGLVKNAKKPGRFYASLGILGIFLLSFAFRPLYRMWHMFRDPVAYPHRFAFLFVFFVMVLAAEGIKKVKLAGKYQAAALGLVSILLVINGYRQFDMELKTLPSASRSDYRIFIDTTADLVEYAKEHSVSVSGGMSLCRISKDYEFTSSDCMLLGYNGIDFFSSSYDPDMLKLYKNLGLLQYHYKSCDEGTTILTDMLLGVDYMIHKGHADSGYEYLTSNGFETLSMNPYSLGIGYLTDGADLQNPDIAFGKNSFENQMAFISGICDDSEGLLEEVDYKEEIIDTYGVREVETGHTIVHEIKREITFTAPAGKNVYLNFELLNESELDYAGKSSSDTIVVSEGDTVIAVFAGYQKAYNIRLGNYENDTEVTVTIEGTNDYRQAYLYALDIDKMESIYEKLNSSRFNISEISGNVIEGNITVPGSGRSLLLTIPYSDKTEVIIDGKLSDTTEYAGALLMVPEIKEGEHTITIKI